MDSDYIPGKLLNKFKFKGSVHFEFHMGDLYLTKNDYRLIGIRTIGELKAAYFKLTNEQLIIPE